LATDVTKSFDDL